MANSDWSTNLIPLPGLFHTRSARCGEIHLEQVKNCCCCCCCFFVFFSVKTISLWKQTNLLKLLIQSLLVNNRRGGRRRGGDCGIWRGRWQIGATSGCWFKLWKPNTKPLIPIKKKSVQEKFNTLRLKSRCVQQHIKFILQITLGACCNELI